MADSNNYTIRKVGVDGEVTTFAGLPGVSGLIDGKGNDARFLYPVALTIDSQGTLYVADRLAVRRITPEGVVRTVFDGSSGTDDAHRFGSLGGITLDPEGNIYLTDTLDHVIRKITVDGEPSVIAGQTGFPGSADGGTGGMPASFNGPTGITWVAPGVLYVADTNNNVIRFVAPDGAFTQSYSGGTGPTPVFYQPRDVIRDASGNVYVADSGSNRILVANLPAGETMRTYAGSPDGRFGSADGSALEARLFSPTGIARDIAGNLYVADAGNAVVRKVDQTTADVTTIAGTASAGIADGPATMARFARPTGVAVDTEGNVFVADSYSSTVRKISPSGVTSTLAGSGGEYGEVDGSGSDARFMLPKAVCVDGSGNVYVADTNNNAIRKITPAGAVTTLAHINSFGPDPFNPSQIPAYPEGIVADQAGNIFVAGTASSAIFKVTPEGDVSTFAGMPGRTGLGNGSGTQARFNHPTGLSMDSTGNIFVADTLGGSIRKITPAGVVTTVAVGITRIRGVAVDAAGNLYASATFDSTIRKIAPDGTITILGGVSGDARFADGTGSAARFWNPNGLAVDSAGNLYVADANNNVIRTGTAAAVAANFATRMRVGTNGDVLIGGFIVTGTAPKKVMVRAIGPSLKVNDEPVPGRLLDPVLELHGSDGSLIRANDNWTSDQGQEITESGLYPTDNRESAIIETLSPGFYTAVVQGAGATSGIGLVEIYDLGLDAPSQIAQIATRGKVLTGDDVMIGGFILNGSGGTDVLVRAIGPELSQQGVTDVLNDPVLAVYNANGDVVRSNDNWRTDQEQAINDTGIPPANDNEAAIVDHLNAGAYTAVVSGKDQTTGVGLVEVYVLH